MNVAACTAPLFKSICVDTMVMFKFWNPSNKSNNRTHATRIAVILAPVVAVMGIAATIAPAFALEIRVNRRNYESCTKDMLSADIDPDTIAAACGSAWRPEELGFCVAQIAAETPAEATTALSNCRQVRRPKELAMCVVDIHTLTDNSEIVEVLDRCRRSLLPERFASCVVEISDGLDSGGVKINPSEAMNACIDARDRIGDIFPTYLNRTGD
jgi:hypothetical protein